MYTVIVFLVLGLIIGIRHTLKEKKKYGVDLEDWAFFLLISGMTGVVVGIITALSFSATETIKREVFSIECIQDGSSVNGDFFLRCGSIDGEMSYTMYVKEGFGFKLIDLDADRCTIMYSDEPPKMIKEIYTNSTRWALDLPKQSTFTIYVPKRVDKNKLHIRR